MTKEKYFPEEVLEVLNELKVQSNDSENLLPFMLKLTKDTDDLKDMWHTILKQKRTELYAAADTKNGIIIFLGMVADSYKEEIPVFYFTEKKKKRIIEQIVKCEEKLERLYSECFSQESINLTQELNLNIAKSIDKIEKSYLRARGIPRIRKIVSFIRELGVRNLIVYENEMNSVIKHAVFAIYDYKYSEDTNIKKLLVWPEKNSTTSDDIDDLLSKE